MSLKHASIGAIVLAACVLGGLWLFLRQVPPQQTLSSFQQTCVQGQRRGISGDIRPLDDGTEARLLAFCSCVEQEVGNRLSQQELAAISLEQGGNGADAKVALILNLCRARMP